MIHIVFNESEVDLMKQVIGQDETLAGNVVQIKDDFAVGPLAGIEQGRLADRLGFRRIGRVELVGLVLERAVERLGDVNHLLELVHCLPQPAALGIDCGIIHQQFVLAVGKPAEDRRNVGLAGAIFVEIMIHLVPERDDPEELAGGHALAGFLGIERFDGAAKFGQIGTDPGIAVDRLHRPVEEAVRRARGLGDFLAAHRGQLVDLLAEIGAIAVERGEFVDELGDLVVELAGLVSLQRHQARGFVHRHRLKRVGRIELDLGCGRGVDRCFCAGLDCHIHAFPDP